MNGTAPWRTTSVHRHLHVGYQLGHLCAHVLWRVIHGALPIPAQVRGLANNIHDKVLWATAMASQLERRRGHFTRHGANLNMPPPLAEDDPLIAPTKCHFGFTPAGRQRGRQRVHRNSCHDLRARRAWLTQRRARRRIPGNPLQHTQRCQVSASAHYIHNHSTVFESAAHGSACLVAAPTLEHFCSDSGTFVF